MPTGPKGEKRPADVIGNAVKVMHILTGGGAEDTPVDDGKDPAAKALGRKGRARAMANGVKLGRKPTLTHHQRGETIKLRDGDG
jgi:hypothetical protein